MVMQNTIPQASVWPSNYKDTIPKGGDYHDPNRKDHVGIDFRNKMNDPVYAALDGEVDSIGPDSNARSGNYIMVRDKYGNLHGHAHSGTVEGLTAGTAVKAGQQIGFSNGTGFTPDGEPVRAHLHYTYRQGTPTAPATMRTPYSDPNLIFQQLRGKPLGWNNR